MHRPFSRSGARWAVVAVLVSGCVQDGRGVGEFADQWAEVVCERWTACGCPVDDCEAEQRQAFFDRWNNPDDEELPLAECFDARVEAIEALTCDFVEEDPFFWEVEACPIAPTFRGPGERCEPAPSRETFAGRCQSGLVCDAMARRCVNPFPPPGLGQPCLRAADRPVDDWVCAPGLVCDDRNLCIEDTDTPRVLPPPLVCDGLLVF